MKKEDSVLLVVDVQENIIDTIVGRREVIMNLKAIIEASIVLKIPILATEQEKLGKIAQEISRLLPDDVSRFKKLAFSCAEIPEFKSKLKVSGRRTVIVGGIETHICVMQTALDLLKLGFSVVVVRDATSSHGVIDRETALDRMRDTGAKIATSESIIYELMGEAGTPEFRKILSIIKDLRASRDSVAS